MCKWAKVTVQLPALHVYEFVFPQLMLEILLELTCCFFSHTTFVFLCISPYYICISKSAQCYSFLGMSHSPQAAVVCF